jgi:hypothetical protein
MPVLSTWPNCKTWRDNDSDFATQAFLADQTCWRPQRGQWIGKFMSGRLSNITELVVRPVGIGRFVTGHMVKISFMLPLPGRREVKTLYSGLYRPIFRKREQIC